MFGIYSRLVMIDSHLSTRNHLLLQVWLPYWHWKTDDNYCLKFEQYFFEILIKIYFWNYKMDKDVYFDL
jgi:hypothetical protein